MVDILVSPQAGMPERHTEENSRLASLQAIIAAIRVRSQAIQTGRGASAASPCGLPMVRVFDPTIKPTEGPTSGVIRSARFINFWKDIRRLYFATNRFRGCRSMPLG